MGDIPTDEGRVSCGVLKYAELSRVPAKHDTLALPPEPHWPNQTM